MSMDFYQRESEREAAFAERRVVKQRYLVEAGKNCVIPSFGTLALRGGVISVVLGGVASLTENPVTWSGAFGLVLLAMLLAALPVLGFWLIRVCTIQAEVESRLRAWDRQVQAPLLRALRDLD